MMTSGSQFELSYFKRFRMEIDLNAMAEPRPLPPGYALIPWDAFLLDQHAEALYYSFLEEIDASVFVSLGTREGCKHLMDAICRKQGFLPAATWLLAGPNCSYCGTVQGVCERSGYGAIQNLGIVSSQRGRGLGTILLLHALKGFRDVAGLGRAYLEVTAQNDAAVQLYHRLGFRRRKTLYKVVETAAVLV
jgi:ribosomal protein S18 acetylase RimI-like enzyme